MSPMVSKKPKRGWLYCWDLGALKTFPDKLIEIAFSLRSIPVYKSFHRNALLWDGGEHPNPCRLDRTSILFSHLVLLLELSSTPVAAGGEYQGSGHCILSHSKDTDSMSGGASQKDHELPPFIPYKHYPVIASY